MYVVVQERELVGRARSPSWTAESLFFVWEFCETAGATAITGVRVAEEQIVGRLIGGRYRLVRALGAGGFGSVWLARDETLGVDVAVKEVRLPPAGTAAEHAELLERAQREARHAAQLRDHPHVVGVHDVVLDGGVPWTVMQLVEGRSLYEQITDEGPLPVPEAVRVATAVLSALDAAHRVGIVHRDVKPANILLAQDGRVLLADFGIAVQQDQTALTASGVFLGSVDYVAPERAQGAPADPSADLFSLGATLYQAVEGRLPFRRDTPVATLTAVLFDPPPPCVLAGPLTPLIEGLLAKDPARRLTGEQATALLAARLKATQPTATVPASPTAPLRPVQSAIPSTRYPAAMVVPPLAVLALIGVAMPLKAFLPRVVDPPPSWQGDTSLDYILVHRLLDLNQFPHAGPTGMPFWLWLLPTVMALAAAVAMPSRVPAAARLPGIAAALILPIRLLTGSQLGSDYFRGIQAAQEAHIAVGLGPGWWLLLAASVAAPVVLLVQYLSARRAGAVSPVTRGPQVRL
ncbi:serine/threonine-protein kinase [Streptomyces sp. NPDC020983]|uniref:serine/threonine-protein kinase n=1 Tax=Streptomyces sp. NPDC020983 TaxID=3365106 RepID=UPI003794E8BF